MNNHKSVRNFLAKEYADCSHGSRRPADTREPLSSDDTFAAPSPEFLRMPPLPGNCLIWRWKLSRDGYGVIGSRKAHRVVWNQVHPEWNGKGHVLHLCHRRCCVQPGHLYIGDDRDNAKDRAARFGKYIPSLPEDLPSGRHGMIKAWHEVNKRGISELEYGLERLDALAEAAQRVWDDPRREYRQESLMPVEPDDCDHSFRIPAGTFRQCLICGMLRLRAEDGFLVRGDTLMVGAAIPTWHPHPGHHIVTMEVEGSVPKGMRWNLLWDGAFVSPEQNVGAIVDQATVGIAHGGAISQ